MQIEQDIWEVAGKLDSSIPLLLLLAVITKRAAMLDVRGVRGSWLLDRMLWSLAQYDVLRIGTDQYVLLDRVSEY